jgi:hypothetical protein
LETSSVHGSTIECGTKKLRDKGYRGLGAYAGKTSDSATESPQEGDSFSQRGYGATAFSRAFDNDPEQAIETLVDSVLTEGASTLGLSSAQAASLLLPVLPSRSPGMQNLVIAALKKIATPEELIQGAAIANRRTKNVRMLQETAGLLEHYGAGAWKALDSLARSGLPECQFFVQAILGCEGVPEQSRIEAARHLATNPDTETRWAVVDALEGGALTDPRSVWDTLAKDSHLGIRKVASECLHDLTS